MDLINQAQNIKAENNICESIQQVLEKKASYETKKKIRSFLNGKIIYRNIFLQRNLDFENELEKLKKTMKKIGKQKILSAILKVSNNKRNEEFFLNKQEVKKLKSSKKFVDKFLQKQRDN